jgi:hypothetical protein
MLVLKSAPDYYKGKLGHLKFWDDYSFDNFLGQLDVWLYQDKIMVGL